MSCYIKNNEGNILTIPLVTLQHLEHTFSPAVLLSSNRVKELPEGQQLGYIKGAADLLSHLKSIHEGGN